MAKKEHKLTICEITQETKAEHFRGWSDEECEKIENGTADDICKIIHGKLYAGGYIVQECHCVVHDKDTREVWDEHLQTYILDAKLRHFHWYGKFFKHENKLYSGTLAQIAAAVGVEPEYVEKAKAGRYGWDNMLAYAVHAKDKHKYQYKPSEVASFGLDREENGTIKQLWKPYMEIYNERKKEWEKGRAQKDVKQATIDINLLEEQILTGDVTKNQVLLTDSMFDVYARNKRRCDDAFDTYTARKIAKTIQAMENGEFKLTVYFITGRSHAGKSFFTDALAKRIKADAKERLGQDWSVCSCAASNPFDDYDGSEILVMDDLRGMALSASDWLKLLDPDRISIASARYRNKAVAARVIIINSEKDVLDFFYYVKATGGGDRSEAMDQFFRRILARVIVYRVGDAGDTRRMLVGHMQETQPFLLQKPGGADNDMLTLNHNFLMDEQDMDFDRAVDYLSNTVMDRNGGGKAV